MFYRFFRYVMQQKGSLLYNKKASTGAIRSKLTKALNFHLFKRDSAACVTRFRWIVSCFSSLCTYSSRRRLFHFFHQKSQNFAQFILFHFVYISNFVGMLTNRIHILSTYNYKVENEKQNFFLQRANVYRMRINRNCLRNKIRNWFLILLCINVVYGNPILSYLSHFSRNTIAFSQTCVCVFEHFGVIKLWWHFLKLK